MKKHHNATKARSRADHGLDLLLALLLLALALVVRWQYVEAIEFPPLGDSAFYLTTAENLVTRQVLEVDVLWNYYPSFATVTHPSHERLMPLTTGLVAAAYAAERLLSGAVQVSLRTGQIASLVVGALLAPLTYLIGRRILPGHTGNIMESSEGSRWVSMGAALLVAVNGTLSYQSASANSSALYALLAAWALSLAVRKPGEQGGYFGAGLLVALACLTQASGLLLLLSIPLAWWLLPLPARPRIELADNPAAAVAWKYWPRQHTVDDGEQRGSPHDKGCWPNRLAWQRRHTRTRWVARCREIAYAALQRLGTEGRRTAARGRRTGQSAGAKGRESPRATAR